MPTANHRAVVETWRAVYDRLTGLERAYQVVNAVAWALRNEGCGLFAKDSGPHGVSADVVIFKPSGETYDILADAEGAARPQWTRTKPTGFGNVTNWRAAVLPVLPAVEPPPSTPGEPPVDPPAPSLETVLAGMVIALARVERQLAELEAVLRAERTVEGRLLGMPASARVLPLPEAPG